MRSCRSTAGLAALLAGLSGAGSPLHSQASVPARSVILLTLDGVRPTEFFGGMDSTVVAFPDSSGIGDSVRIWRAYWRPTATERRRAVMPFFWDSLAPRGLVLGDPANGGRAVITNGEGFSAPGYLEILTGSAQPVVTSNDPVRYPFETVLQFVRRKLGLGPMQVAAFTSWENFRGYVSNQAGDVYVNAGFDTVPEPFNTPVLARLTTLQGQALPAWEGSRLDAFTGGLALEYLRQQRPPLLFVAFDDTDDFAHLRKYGRVLDALHAADAFIRDLWHTVQSLPAYRGRTTLVITTDHGRGLTPGNWTDHGRHTPGSAAIWAAVFGPFTPAGDGAGLLVSQSQIAATVLTCLDLDPAEFSTSASPPIPGACRR
jgi:Type I phosphodiesterase / nucleotide pyrophosphatase